MNEHIPMLAACWSRKSLQSKPHQHVGQHLGQHVVRFAPAFSNCASQLSGLIYVMSIVRVCYNNQLIIVIEILCGIHAMSRERFV